MIVLFYAFRVGNIFHQESDHRVVSGADGFAQRGVAIAVGIVSIGQKQPARLWSPLSAAVSRGGAILRHLGSSKGWH